MPNYTGSYRSRILQLLKVRGLSKTACPSELLPPHLKKSTRAMESVRAVADKLAREGRIEILRKGQRRLPGQKGPIRLRLKKQSLEFDYSLGFKKINFRKRPELYRVGKGEQGVLLVEPYKSEILPYWKFSTPILALASAKKIYSLFLTYGKNKDFIGMDMARKFLQMGVTRSRRYANHKSGEKYIGAVPKDKKGQSGAHGRVVAPLEPDLEKARSAKLFMKYLAQANSNKKYKKWRTENG